MSHEQLTEDEKEQAKIRELEKRAPSRKSIHDRLPRRPARDPWLDDEHDWDL